MREVVGSAQMRFSIWLRSTLRWRKKPVHH
jgi:hypothetical protein